MKKKDITELRSKKLEELVRQVSDKKIDLVKTHANMKVAKEKNIRKARTLRGEIAKILTIIREKQLLS